MKAMQAEGKKHTRSLRSLKYGNDCEELKDKLNILVTRFENKEKERISFLQ